MRKSSCSISTKGEAALERELPKRLDVTRLMARWIDAGESYDPKDLWRAVERDDPDALEEDDGHGCFRR